MSAAHFRRVNGFSNQFWGWGGEDDDMSTRVRANSLAITRYTNNIARSLEGRRYYQRFREHVPIGRVGKLLKTLHILLRPEDILKGTR